VSQLNIFILFASMYFFNLRYHKLSCRERGLIKSALSTEFAETCLPNLYYFFLLGFRAIRQIFDQHFAQSATVSHVCIRNKRTYNGTPRLYTLRSYIHARNVFPLDRCQKVKLLTGVLLYLQGSLNGPYLSSQPL